MQIDSKILVFIFSKDRACQLEQLLRSLEKNAAPIERFNIAVLFDSSSSSFNEGYQIIAKQYPSVRLIRQNTNTSISLQVKQIVQAAKETFICFMVDDNILIRTFSLNDPQFLLFEADKTISYLGLRFSPEICYSQTFRTVVPPPAIDCSGRFQWRYPLNRFQKALAKRGFYREKYFRHWSFPLALDGNITRREHLAKVFDKIKELKTVGEIEREFWKHPPSGDFGICYPKARLINTPLNRVDTDVADWPHANISPEMLNTQFIQGKRLDFSWLENLLINSSHIEVPVFWQDETREDKRRCG